MPRSDSVAGSGTGTNPPSSILKSPASVVGLPALSKSMMFNPPVSPNELCVQHSLIYALPAAVKPKDGQASRGHQPT